MAISGEARESVLDGSGLDLVLGALVHPLDIRFDLGLLDPPLAAPADLDGAEIAGTDEGPSLGDRDIEQLGHIGQRQEATFDGHEVTSPIPNVHLPPDVHLLVHALCQKHCFGII